MRPSIGRIVLYQRHGSPNGQHKAEPSAAVITSVYPPDFEGQEGLFVDLCVLNPTGIYFDRKTPHDSLDDDGKSEGPWTPGHWRWPPRVA